MASFFRMNIARGFSLDPDEVRETARRQFTISLVIVIAALFILAFAGARSAMNSAPAAARAADARVVDTGRDFAPPIRAYAREVERSGSVHKVALAGVHEAD